MAALGMLQSKWRLGFLLLFSVVFIAACSGSDAPEPTQTEAAPSATEVSASGSTGTTTSGPAGGSGGGTIGLDQTFDEVIELYKN